MDVSFIVPVYNALPYLEKTVESLVGQEYPKERYEIIFVDDGSTDGSGEYLDQVEAREENVRVTHIPNSGGAGRPRNVGLQQARGEYVFFQDADDWLELDATRRMMEHACEWNSDVLLVKQVGENGRRVSAGIFNSSVANIDRFDSCLFNALGPCKLFRRALWERCQLAFEESSRVWEDQPVVARALLAADVVSVAADGAYAHIEAAEGSATSARRDVGVAGAVRYIENMLAVFADYPVADVAKFPLVRVMREGGYYLALCLADVRDAEGAGACEQLRRELVEPLRARLLPYQHELRLERMAMSRSLIVQALLRGDYPTAMQVAVLSSEDELDLFADGALEYSAADGKAWLTWEDYQLNAVGSFGLALKYTGMSVGRGRCVLEGTADERAFVGAQRAMLTLASAGAAVQLSVPVAWQFAQGPECTWSADLSSVLGQLQGVRTWNMSMLVEYAPGRQKSSRVALAPERVLRSHEAFPLIPAANKRGKLTLRDQREALSGNAARMCRLKAKIKYGL